MPSNPPFLLSVASLAVGISLLGCGGADTTPEPTGPYTHPSDFDRSNCTGGQLSDDLSNVYHVLVDWGGGYSDPISFRVDDTDAPTGVLNGDDALALHHYGDDDLVISTVQGSDGQALDLCGRDSDGNLHGHYVVCSSTASPACVQFPFDSGDPVPLFDATPAVGMHELGELGGDWPWHVFHDGYSVNVRVDGGLAYVARYNDGLRIVDVHDPAHMHELAHLPHEEAAPADEIYNDVKVAHGTAGAGAGKTYALMASNVHGIVVVDVTTPTAPTIVAHFGSSRAADDPRSNVHTLFLDGGKAYLATLGHGLEIFDLADPTAPVLLGSYDLTAQSYVHDLYVAGDRAYLNMWGDGLVIVDVSHPEAVVQVGQFAGYGETTSHSNWVTTVGDRTIAIHGDEQWNAHVHIVDVTEGSPTFATSIGEFQTRRAVSVHNIMALGSLGIVSYYQDGVRILDLSDPTHPKEVGHFSSWPGYGPKGGYSFYEGAVGVDVDPVTKNVYIADGYRGLIATHLDL
jgi:hypothetical protein